MIKKTRLLIISILVIFILTACSSRNANDTDVSSEASDTTRKITDSLEHSIQVPKNPQRIIGTYLEDYLVALDKKPIAQWTVGSGSVLEYLQDKLADIPTISYDLPYEYVLNYEPDLLLISSSDLVEGNKYNEYSKIAPTYVVKNGEDVTWKDTFKDVAKVLGKEKQAKEQISKYEKDAAKLKTDLKKSIGDKSVAVLWVTNNSAFVVAEDRASGPLLYNDLGFKAPSVVAEISKNATSDWSAISNEKLAELDADYIFLVDSDKDAAMYNESYWKNIPAVQNNQVYRFDSSHSWQYSGPIASSKMLDDVRQTFIK